MRQWEKASSCLHQKMQILERIAVNTEAQCRFIYRREMKGLERTLGEREVLIKKLNSVNEELASNQGWENMQGFAQIIQDIICKQQELMDRSNQAIQQAIAERNRIGAELRNSKAQRQVKSKYTNPWAAVVPGRYFNESR